MDIIKPMLCRAGDISKLSSLSAVNAAAELKLDGMRALVYHKDKEIRIFGRSGLEYTHHLHEDMLRELKHSIPNNSIFDGELAHISSMHEVEPSKWIPVVDFNKTMRVMGSGPAVALQKQRNTPIDFIAFDVIEISGQDLKQEPYYFRRESLESLQSNLLMSPVWNLQEYTTDVFELFQTLSRAKFEGLVLKKLYGTYKPNSRTEQMKFKSEKYFDVVVMGATPGKGKYEGMIGALKFGAYDDNGTLVEIGQCSGMTDAERAWWTNRLLTTQLSQDVIEIKCNDLLSTGTPRHPQYIGRRSDKPPIECTMEQFNA